MDMREKAIETVIERIDRYQEEIIKFLQEYVRIKSTNFDFVENPQEGVPTEEETCQKWIYDNLQKWKIFEKIDFWEGAKGRPSLAAVLKGAGGKGQSLMFNGHTDTVSVSEEQKSKWEGSPWSGEFRDGKVWGRGAVDMKGGNIAFLMAAKMLSETGIKLNNDLILTLTIGEESGRHWLGCDTILQRGYKAPFAIITEPTNMALWPTLKGEIYFKITVSGKATHICNRNQMVQPLPYGKERPGVSAIDKMLKIQQEIMNLENQWALYREHPLNPQGGMFININTIKGGESWSSQPAVCEVTGSTLFNPDLSSDEVISEIKAAVDRVTQGDYWLKEHPPTLEIPWYIQLKEPVNVSPNHPGCKALAGAHKRIKGVDPTITCGTCTTDANYWFPQGQDTVIYGPGDITMGCHGANEYLPVDQLIEASKIMAIMMIDWCEIHSFK